MVFRHAMGQLRPARTQKIDLLEKSQILLQEGNTQAAFDMEQVILSAAGGPFFKSKLIPNSKKVGDKIATKLKLKGKGGKMPNSTYSASKEWSEYFKPSRPKGSTLTPKTDMIIGKFRVSLKTGPAVLMSGEKKEATATFYTAMDKTGTVDKAVKKLQKHIDNLLPSTDMTKLNIKGNKTELIKSGKFAEIEILKKADEAHHAFKNDMRDVFANSPDFAREFVFEAMTGQTKFGNNEGTATHFLVTDFEGLKPTIHKVTKSSDAYVGKLIKYVNPDVTFKSTQKEQTKAGKKTKTGYYTFWSAVKVGVNMIVEEEVKNGLLLNEGVFDFIKRVYTRAMNWIKNFFNKIYEVLKKSYKALVEFMDFEPVISANGLGNDIEWPS
jgi:hypothetical protein